MKTETGVDLQKGIGRVFEQGFRATYGSLPGYDRVRNLLIEGKIDEGLRAIYKLAEGNTASVQGLQKAVEGAFPGQKAEGVEEALRKGDYLTAVRLIGDAKVQYDEIQRSAFNDATAIVAERLCGSTLRYTNPRGQERLAVLSRVAAWQSVGGKDQTIPEAAPGTVGVWESNRYGRKVEVGIISAHSDRHPGIVAIWGVYPLSKEGTLEAEVTGKTEIAREYGFTDSRVSGRNLSLEKLPLEIADTLPLKALRTIGGEDFVPVQEKKVNHKGFITSYRLERM